MYPDGFMRLVPIGSKTTENRRRTNGCSDSWAMIAVLTIVPGKDRHRFPRRSSARRIIC
eukprot:COSAG02_NODE_58822_length_276_cov_0.587571_1_plen_58_part_01